ncbi:dTMP kinase [Candidatus Woesebacteria bacterium]|jgi:dTMP kinase|nr:dTMP kinase [Candidatus Woesebacteria bacterium]HOA12000.1 dTMP kinase [Candidatus Woesebacteria bacterium]HOI05168.1 dTMP kinase [Candidatus Woesebacteria bacterium]HOP38678.1 dTMP kinase [Candidatus Woesebacteria bacterium]HPA62133.1 dTMP kinase [Candidatus Woesebacteria bacterium]
MQSNGKRGLLITLEGGEGGGKTTQIVRLKNHLIEAGKDVVVLREPGGTVISEQIREVVLSSKNTGIAFTTEVLLFQAARSQIYREIVLPSLKAGKVVIMDRSRDSSVVYQGMVRGFGTELIEQLNDISTKKTYPDLTFLLDIPVNIGLKRRNGTGEVNRLDMEATDFHEKVRQGYLTLAKKDQEEHGKKARWVIIDARPSIDQVEDNIWQVVKQYLAKKELSTWEDNLAGVDLEYSK